MSERFVQGEVLIKFRDGIPEGRKEALTRRLNARERREFRHVGVHHLTLHTGASVAATIAELSAVPDVQFVEPNYIRRITAPAPPNDPLWLNGTLWGMERIGMSAAWSAFTTGSKSVIVAVLDTGVDYNHPDLAANIWTNPLEIPANGIDDDGNGYVDDVHGIDTANHDSDPMDDHGHGTHVAGTIAAVGNNGVGVVGVGWTTTLMPCKLLAADGTGTDAAVIECFNYVVDQKLRGANVKVTSNSYGGARVPPSMIPQALKNAIDAAGNAGIVNVCAAGNAGTNNDTKPFDPASLDSPSIVSVAASDQADNRPDFSNYGVTSVDLAAPGTSIASTYLNNGYANASGTSMATPHVSGAAALLAVNGSLTVAQIKSLLLNGVDHFATWNGVVASGGRLNVFRSLQLAVMNTAPTVSLTQPSEGATFQAPATLQISATAGDVDGVVTKVEFFGDGNSIGTDTSAPYGATWVNPPAGVRTITAVATDNGGATATSAAVHVTIAESYSLTATPASVNAGGPITVTWSAPANRPANDWIGLFKVGDPDTNFRWWQYTGGANGGNVTVPAPADPGSFEFRYFLSNGYQKAAQSNAVTVVAGTGSFTLTVSATAVTAGDPLTVTWTAPAGRPANDWIGLFPIGSNSYVWWQYTGGAAAGAFAIPAPSTAGQYEFRYLLSNGFTAAAQSATVTVSQSGGGTPSYSLTASPTTVTAGASITVTWTAPSGRPPTDWIGLFAVGAGNSSYTWWQYTGGSTSGTLNVPAPLQPGQYEFRYLLNNGYTSATQSNVVTVSSGGGGSVTLTAAPSSVTIGQSLTVTWSAASPHASDWIGLFPTTSGNTGYVWWQYTGAKATGSFTLPAPAQPGQYEFRYLPDNGYTSVANSNTVTVASTQAAVPADLSNVRAPH